MNFRNLHLTSKIIIIALVGVSIYIGSFILLTPDTNGMPMRGRMMFDPTANIITGGSSIAVGLIGMLFTSLVLFRRHENNLKEENDEFSIMKRALTEDETSLLEIVRAEEDGITQDSLRFRLDWSKAKVSTMLTNLDRMGLVQRERFGKTYKVHYQSENNNN